GGVGAVGALYGQQVLQVTETANARAAELRTRAKAERAGKGAPVPFGAVDDLPQPDWKVMIIPVSVYLGVLLLGAYTSVFNMRAIGLLGFYFKDQLDLVSEVEEKKYVY